MTSRMHLTRRNLVRGALLGAGAVGLRSLVTGLPPGFLTSGSLAHAADGALNYLIIASSQQGDPLNANAPGTYIAGVDHNPSAALVETDMTLGGVATTGAKPWADLSEDLRQRMAFIHHRTYTNAHPEMSRVLGAHGSVTALDSNASEQFPSVLADVLSGGLGTVQGEPAPIGFTPMTYAGRPLDLIKPTELQSLFGEPEELQATLRSLRDAELDAIYADLKESGTRPQRAFFDRYALGRDQARQIGAELGEQLARVPVDGDDTNGGRDQVIAAVALLKLNITPVVGITIPFGGDNHADSTLSQEAAETVSGAATLQLLWDELKAAGLEDKATFASLDVFGRTLKRSSSGGRDHHGDHHAMCLFGPRIKGGVAGGLQESGGDFQATGIDSASGASSSSADISAEESLESALRTVACAVGVEADTQDQFIAGGRAIEALLL